jgi:myo-inositol-1(or 4)-monophosphatase
MSRAADLRRIEQALERAGDVLRRFTPGRIEHRIKERGDPVTEADMAVNEVLLANLPQGDEGWLSEETVDDALRLSKSRVWVVDPVDGTKEFVQGVPEWCVSVGLVEEGRAVAGGLCIPARDLMVVGAVGDGVRANGKPCRTRDVDSLEGAEVLASRSEVGRGEWKRFEKQPFTIRPMGSVALKLGLVAAGLSDATWTLVPKHEWDVAAGTALVLAAGGEVWTLDGQAPQFNRPRPLFSGLIATAPGLRGPVESLLAGS